MKFRNVISNYLILSFIAVIILVILILLNLNHEEAGKIDFLSRAIVGSTFIVVCIFGISLAVKPNWVKNLKKSSNKTFSRVIHHQEISSNRRSGHHPVCDNFKEHSISISNKRYCSGCVGLAVGACIGIILALFYIFTPLIYTINLFYFIFFTGLIFIVVNYLEIIISKRRPIVHILTNIFLVIGFYLMVISVFELTREVFFSIVGILFSFLWLDTRIQLSDWNHKRICNECSQKCPEYT